MLNEGIAIVDEKLSNEKKRSVETHEVTRIKIVQMTLLSNAILKVGGVSTFLQPAH